MSGSWSKENVLFFRGFVANFKTYGGKSAAESPAQHRSWSPSTLEVGLTAGQMLCNLFNWKNSISLQDCWGKGVGDFSQRGWHLFFQAAGLSIIGSLPNLCRAKTYKCALKVTKQSFRFESNDLFEAIWGSHANCLIKYFSRSQTFFALFWIFYKQALLFLWKLLDSTEMEFWSSLQ